MIIPGTPLRLYNMLIDTRVALGLGGGGGIRVQSKDNSAFHGSRAYRTR